MSSTQVRNQVRDCVEGGFDALHRIADVDTFPFAPLDGAIHGTARGVSNWLLDQHPEDRSRGRNHNDGSRPQNCQPQPQCYPAQPHYNPPPPQNYQNYPAQPQYYHPPPPPQGYPGYPSHHPSGNGLPGAQNIHGVSNRTGNNKGDDNGSIKVGNFGGS